MRTSRWARSAVLTGISLLALGASLMVGVGASFAAATAPPWEPDGNAAAPYGNVTFYDANGNQVTSGTSLSQPVRLRRGRHRRRPGSHQGFPLLRQPTARRCAGQLDRHERSRPDDLQPQPGRCARRHRGLGADCTRSWPPRQPASRTGWRRTSPTPPPATPTPSRSA